MFMFRQFHLIDRRVLRAAIALFLFTILLLLPQAAQAQAEAPVPTPGSPLSAFTPDPSDTRPCSSCHAEESAAWQASPHAALADPQTGQALATCTSCHGDYSRGHPDKAVVPLRVDSSSCRECHTETWSQWEGSLHGNEGVQCISCHLPHSQEMRLTDERMCTSCHRESLDDSLHQAHWQSEATCTDCHMAGAAEHNLLASAGNDLSALNPLAPSHDFVTVSATKCLDCHREDVAAGPAGESSQTVAYNELSARLPVVEKELQQARQTTRTLGFLSVASLGFGLGIGGLLGIIFMVLYARWFSNNSKREGQS